MKDLKIFTGIVNTVIKYFKWILFVAAVLILCSGIVRVDSNEEAIVLRFGSLVGDTREEQILKPGLHFTLPFFVDEVIKVPVQSVKELTVTTHMTNGNSLKNLYESGYLLTGDNNIVLLSANVKYKITDPVAYALYIGDVDCTINGVVSGVLTETVCSMYVDQVLTTDRTALAETAKSASQSELDQLQVGVTVTNVEFSQIVPPGQCPEPDSECFRKAVGGDFRRQE